MRRVLVVGDIILDKYIEGKVTRVSPEAPVPIVNVISERLVLGGCANVAHNLANLGIDTTILGVIGNDANGKQVKELLAQKQIKSLITISDSLPSISKIRLIGEKQQIARIDYEDSSRKMDLVDLDLENKLYGNYFDAIVISDYNKNVCTEDVCKSIIKFATVNQIKVLVDPKGSNWEKYEGSYIVTPNLKELQEVSQKVIDNIDEDIERVGLEIKLKYKIENLIVTRSEKGMTLIDSYGRISHYPTVAREVFDVSGAGDTVIAVLAKYVAEGLSTEKAIELANIAAGYVVSKMGTYAISAEELRQQKR